MARKLLVNILENAGACCGALDWAKEWGNDYKGAWESCTRPDWMIWSLTKLECTGNVAIKLLCLAIILAKKHAPWSKARTLPTRQLKRWKDYLDCIDYLSNYLSKNWLPVAERGKDWDKVAEKWDKVAKKVNKLLSSFRRWFDNLDHDIYGKFIYYWKVMYDLYSITNNLLRDMDYTYLDSRLGYYQCDILLSRFTSLFSYFSNTNSPKRQVCLCNQIRKHFPNPPKLVKD